jgi:N-acetylmuramoyl-L-alanine amidase
MRHYLLTILVLILFGAPAVSSRFGSQVDEITKFFSDTANQFASVILSHNPKSVADIQARYYSPNIAVSPVDLSITNTGKVKILLVPGHEPGYGGAEYRDLKERDMTVELAQDLESFLNTNGHYQVFVTRDTYQWSTDFSNYFKK